jgi:hypothetical protein
MDFEINGDTYFVDLAENAGWEVFVSTPTGARSIPVYDDAPELSITLQGRSLTAPTWQTPLKKIITKSSA